MTAWLSARPRAWSLLSCLLPLLASCKAEVTGPAPQVSGLEPQTVCAAQLTTPVVLSGSALSPLATDTLTTNPKVVLPKISLIRTRDIAGADAALEPRLLPDEAPGEGPLPVEWTSQ